MTHEAVEETSDKSVARKTAATTNFLQIIKVHLAKNTSTTVMIFPGTSLRSKVSMERVGNLNYPTFNARANYETIIKNLPFHSLSLQENYTHMWFTRHFILHSIGSGKYRECRKEGNNWWSNTHFSGKQYWHASDVDTRTIKSHSLSLRFPLRTVTHIPRLLLSSADNRRLNWGRKSKVTQETRRNRIRCY